MIQLIAFFIHMILLSQVNSQFQCGVPRVRTTSLILQGQNTSEAQWPWHAAIYHTTRYSQNYVCGGTLISEWYVLSAAHCVLNQDTKYRLSTASLLVRLGVHNLKMFNNRAVQDHSIEKIDIPDGFESDALRDDITVLKLSTKAEFDRFVQPACLNEEKDLTGQMGTVIGWGITEHNNMAAVLKSVKMPVIAPLTCLKSNRHAFGETLDEGVFCAGYTTGTGVCNGDSGGGLFFNRESIWFLGGIVAFSVAREDDENLCTTKGYGAFTNVANYLPWIRRLTGIEAGVRLADTTTTTKRPQRSEFNVQSPCPDLFTYQRNPTTGQIEGHIEIPSRLWAQTVKVNIELSIAAQLPDVNYGSLEFVKSKEETHNDILRGNPAHYRVNFPFQQILPSVVKITLNGQTICRGSPAQGSLVSTMSFEHTFTSGQQTIYEQGPVEGYRVLNPQPRFESEPEFYDQPRVQVYRVQNEQPTHYGGTIRLNQGERRYFISGGQGRRTITFNSGSGNWVL